MSKEQTVLRVSVLATVMLALSGVVLGLATGSTDYDGVYALADAAMTALAESRD